MRRLPRRWAACLLFGVLTLTGCDKGSPSVGTETGNALTVAGRGGDGDLTTASAEIAEVQVRDAACGAWTVVARDVTLDALGDATIVPLSGAVCGVRLQLASVLATAQRGPTSVSAEATDFALTFEFAEAIERPELRLRHAGWLDGIDDDARPGSADAVRLAENVRRSATAHRDVDDDEILDEDSSDEDDDSEGSDRDEPSDEDRED